MSLVITSLGFKDAHYRSVLFLKKQQSRGGGVVEEEQGRCGRGRRSRVGGGEE